MFKKLNDLRDKDKLDVTNLWQTAQYDPDVPSNVSDTMDKQEMYKTRNLRADKIGLEIGKLANTLMVLYDAAESSMNNKDILQQINALESIKYNAPLMLKTAENLLKQFTDQERQAAQNSAANDAGF